MKNGVSGEIENRVQRVPISSVRVECHAGYRGEETPRCFFLGPRKVEVVDVLDRWLAPEHRYFKIQGDDGCRYILRHYALAGVWEMAMFESAPP